MLYIIMGLLLISLLMGWSLIAASTFLYIFYKVGLEDS
jgi:hypothetical protein